MGMYTRIELSAIVIVQIKFGDDNLDTYCIGDIVPRQINENHPGQVTFGDDVYHGYIEGDAAEDGSDEAWVVVKDGAIHAAIPHNALLQKLGSQSLIYDYLMAEYGIETYEHSWWPEEMWFQKRLEDAERSFEDARERYEFLKACEPLSQEQRDLANKHWIGQALAEPLRRAMFGPGLAYKIFGMAGNEEVEEPLPPSLEERIASVISSSLEEAPPKNRVEE